MPLPGKPSHPSGHLPHQWTPSPCTEKKNILSPLKRCFLLLFLHYKVNIQNQLIITENYCMMILQSLFHREFPYRSPRAGITQMPVKVKQLKTDMKSILAQKVAQRSPGQSENFHQVAEKTFHLLHWDLFSSWRYRFDPRSSRIKGRCQWTFVQGYEN